MAKRHTKSSRPGRRITAKRLRARPRFDGLPSVTSPSRTFLQELRAERRAFLEKNYSKPAQLFFAIRDRVFVMAVAYVIFDVCSRSLNMRAGLSQPVANWLLGISIVIIMLLFISVISDFPVARVVQHLRARVLPRSR